MTVSRRVLVVEDDAALCGMLVEALTLEGLHTVGATDGNTAVRSLALFRPELVVTDLSIGGATPDEIARAYRKLIGPKAPLLLLSGLAEAEVAAQATRLGATDFLVKPFNIADLLDAVDALLVPVATPA